jgi:hypothetical protein
MQMNFKINNKNVLPKSQEKSQEKSLEKSKEKSQEKSKEKSKEKSEEKSQESKEAIVNVPISRKKYNMFLKASHSKKCSACGYHTI